MKIAVAMSGGVDSSVAAYLLQKQGYEIIGVTMIPFDNEKFGFAKDEGALAAVADAKKVCDVLNIEHVVISVEDAFEKIVIGDFFSEYSQGRTPNPCTLCNPTIKWGVFFEKALALGYDKIATGHYVHIEEKNGEFQVFQADDLKKDQSYMLWGLNQYQLGKTIFPISKYRKSEIRILAEEANLPIAQKKDSQEICFIKEHYEDLLKENQKVVPGNITMNGKVIGSHKGFQLYTIGQRKGLNTPWHSPLYVKSIDSNKNEVVVTDDPDELLQKDFIITDTNWLAGHLPDFSELTVQIRYNSRPTAIENVEFYGRFFKVILDKPARAISPGQSAVFYNDNQLIGGGVIS